MKKWMNRIGIALLAAAAFSMIAADLLLAGEPSNPLQPTAQKFYLQFSILAPGDLQCDATGPGVRTKLSHGITGTPLLRITGNAAGARIDCWTPDGSHYTTDLNRQVRYNTSGAIRATVMLQPGLDAADVMLERDNQSDRMPSVIPNAFAKVQE